MARLAGKAELEGKHVRYVGSTLGRRLGLLVAFSATLATFLAADASAAIYWGHSSVIGRALNDGSEALTKTTGFIGTSTSSHIGRSCGVAVNDSHIYWADSKWDRIGRATVDGYTEIDSSFITGAEEPCGVALDGDYVYWANRGGNSIGRARLDGGRVDQSFVHAASGHAGPCGVAVDDDFVYWAGSGPGVVGRALLLGGSKGPPLVEDHENNQSCGIAVTDEHLFWGSYGEEIGRIGIEGTDPDPEFIDGVDRPCGLTTYDSRLYWSEEWVPYGRISRSRLSGADIDRGLVEGISSLGCGGVAVDSLGAITPAPPPPISDYRIAKIKRNKRRGIVFLAVDLAGDGYFSASVAGMRVVVFPERVRQNGYLAAGRKWLRIMPLRAPGGGSKCIRRALRRGWIVQRSLKVRFSEPGKTLVEKNKKLRFFRVKRHRKLQRPRRVTGCYAMPK